MNLSILASTGVIVDDMTQAISSVGFPIFACCMMYYQNLKQQETLTEVTKALISLESAVTSLKEEVKRAHEN